MMIIQNYSPWGHFILETVQGTPGKHGATEKANIPGWNVTWSVGYSTRYSTSWNFSCSKLTCVCVRVRVRVCVCACSLRHVQLFAEPGSSVHGISQARILEQVAISPSRGSLQPRDWTRLLSFLHRQAESLPLAPSGKPTANLNIFQLFRPLIY